MSDIQPAPILDVDASLVVSDAGNPGSLHNRIAERRAELSAQKPFDIEVPGYDGMLRARYHALDYRVIRQIALRQEKNPNKADAEVNTASDSLVQACEGLFEVMEDGSLRDTGHVWNEAAARDVFGIDFVDLPAGSTARLALQRMIPNSMNLVSHYYEWQEHARGVVQEVDKDVAGELEAV